MNDLQNLLGQYLPEYEAEYFSAVIRKGDLIVITGRQGPTGKTTLCRELKRLGYSAIEREEFDQSRDGRTDDFAIVIIYLNET